MLVYGLGGLIAPFIGIKLVDLVIHNLLGASARTMSARPPQDLPGHGGGRRQDLPHAPGGPARAAAGPESWSATWSRTGRPRRRSGQGLECAAPEGRVPRGRLQEMDLPAIFQRAPELCLIDELAHTNAPGLEHRKRYEDIEDVLDAGIDVFSTVNVQHLESLNDRVAELTGVRCARRSLTGCSLRPTRWCWWTSARGADPAPARGQGLTFRAGRGGPERFLPGGEPRHPARDRAAPGRGGRRG